MQKKSLNIAVIGANGRSGRAFVAAALAAGHSVRAGVHRHNPFGEQPRLTAVTCDATNPHDVAHLLKGQDAVVSLIGHVRGSKPDVQTRSMTCIVQVMSELHMRRLVSLTGTGVRFDGDHISLIDRLMNGALAIVDPARIADGRNHLAVLQQSSLDWTVLRVLKLQNRSAGVFILSDHGPAKTFVGRDDVAQAIMQVLEADSYKRQAPIISV